MVTRWLFTGLLALLGVQRLAEMRLSRRNEDRILAQGGREHAAEHFRTMKVLHAAWFAAILGEVFGLKRPFQPGLALVAALLSLVGQSLRYAAIRNLGERWTVNVMTLPGEPPVQTGIYRYLRHPNYLGVILELLAVPLLHSAYLTSAVFSLANAWLLSVRIAAEEQALREDCNYQQVFGQQPRFFPSMAALNAGLADRSLSIRENS